MAKIDELFREMKEAGAKTFAQSADTCVVNGMPQEAIELGAVDEVIPLDQIPDKIMDYVLKTENNNNRTYNA